MIEYGRVLTTPFARYAEGDEATLSPFSAARRKAEMFFGAGGWTECHADPLFSDMGFRAITLPQVDPGKRDGRNGL